MRRFQAGSSAGNQSCLLACFYCLFDINSTHSHLAAETARCLIADAIFLPTTFSFRAGNILGMSKKCENGDSYQCIASSAHSQISSNRKVAKQMLKFSQRFNANSPDQDPTGPNVIKDGNLYPRRRMATELNHSAESPCTSTSHSQLHQVIKPQR